MGCCASKEHRKGVIYRLPRENYVGKTVQEPKTRIDQHRRAGKDVRGATVVRYVRL